MSDQEIFAEPERLRCLFLLTVASTNSKNPESNQRHSPALTSQQLTELGILCVRASKIISNILISYLMGFFFFYLNTRTFFLTVILDQPINNIATSVVSRQFLLQLIELDSRLNTIQVLKEVRNII